MTPARIDVPDVYETALVEIGGDLVSFIVERDGTEGGADDVIAFGKELLDCLFVDLAGLYRCKSPMPNPNVSFANASTTPETPLAALLANFSAALSTVSSSNVRHFCPTDKS